MSANGFEGFPDDQNAGKVSNLGYLKAYDSVSAARAGIAWYFEFYNARRPHQAHGGRTPDMVYYETLTTAQAAA